MNYLQEPIVIYTLVFAAVVLPIAAFAFGRGRQDEKSDAAKRTAAGVPSVLVSLSGVAELLEIVVGEPLAKMMPERVRAYEGLIAASGINLASGSKLTPARLLAMKAVTGAVATVFGALLYIAVPEHPGAMAGAWAFLSFVGWSYPSLRLESHVQWRQNEITRAMPFSIDLMSSAMKAGLDFGAAMRYYESLKIPGPLTEEFGAVLKDVELGKSRVEALNDMAARVQTDTLKSFAGVVAYGTEIGASISDTLRVQGEEMRRARFHIAERKAARAPSLMIMPLAVFILPAVFIIIIVPVMMQMGAATVSQ